MLVLQSDVSVFNLYVKTKQIHCCSLIKTKLAISLSHAGLIQSCLPLLAPDPEQLMALEQQQKNLKNLENFLNEPKPGIQITALTRPSTMC